MEIKAVHDPAIGRAARGARSAVSLECEVRQASRPWAKVRLQDISQEGFRITWLPVIDMTTPLRVKIPGLQLLSAHIRWRSGQAVGCQFTEPLSVFVYEHIARGAG